MESHSGSVINCDRFERERQSEGDNAEERVFLSKVPNGDLTTAMVVLAALTCWNVMVSRFF